MISGDLGYVGKERLQEIRQEIGDLGEEAKIIFKDLLMEMSNDEFNTLR
jgi:hypothetical protein